MFSREIIIKDTHRGLWYEDGVLTNVLGAGRYSLPEPAGCPSSAGRGQSRSFWWTCRAT